MAADRPVFEFRSDQFAIEQGEGEQTNPGCYGRELGEWLRASLVPDGEALIAEDWGWCVMLQRQPFQLWIGCANSSEARIGAPPMQPVAWYCQIGADFPVWTSYFWKRLIGRVSPDATIVAAADRLSALLRSNPRIFDLSRDLR